jgi:hypothetical protein
MRFFTRYGAVFCIAWIMMAVICPAQQPTPTMPAEHPASGATPGIVEEILAKSSGDAGYMEAEQVKAAADQMRFAEYRIQDLLSDVHPEKWKMPEESKTSFGATVSAVRTQLDALKSYRTDLADRPDSIYAGFETYLTIGTILPRLEGIARTISEADNASFGAQFSEAGNRLFDLQQKLGPYLSFLLRNQDSILLALENNLASCQNDLGHAMHGQTERPKWMKNSAPVRAHRTKSKASSTDSNQKNEPPKP